LRRVFLPLLKDDGEVKLMLFVKEDQAEVVKALRRIFRKPELCGDGKSTGPVSVPLPKGAAKMARAQDTHREKTLKRSFFVV